MAFVFYEEYKEAIAIYKSILSVTKDANYTLQSLNSMLHIYRVTQDKELLEYLRGYSRSEANSLSKVIYASALIVGGYVDEALSEYGEIAKNYPNTYDEVLALKEQSFIYCFYKNDIKRARKILEVLEKIAPDNYDVIRLKSKIERATIVEGSKGYFGDKELKETEVKLEGYTLSNYPNPFNPTTTIQYSIPKDEFVKLTVYDITGRVVKELVSGHKTAGKYSVEFNASNYASGTYYYKIEAGEYKNIQKMMLVK
jgi:tetratricopeptide (TPR) repeat protein